MTKDQKREKRERAHMEWANSEVGKRFREWWKGHHHAGYATKGSEVRWGIQPYTGWNTWRYKSEFYVEHEDEFIWPEDLRKPQFEDIKRWTEERKAAEEMTAELEKELGKEFWKRISPEKFFAAFWERGSGKA